MYYELISVFNAFIILHEIYMRYKIVNGAHSEGMVYKYSENSVIQSVK